MWLLVARTGIGIILVGQATIEDVHPEDFAPLQMLDQGDAVEQHTIQLGRHVQRCVSVVQELHVVHHVKMVELNDVRLVGCRESQQGERHLVPHDTTLQRGVDASP